MTVSPRVITEFLQTKRKFKCRNYIIGGSVMLALSVLTLILYIDNFRITIENEATLEEFCRITKIEIKTHSFNCWDGEMANIVELPCIKILLKTAKLSNITFYRNIHEKVFVNENHADVRNFKKI